jgi:hypothetical protein
MRKPEEKSGQAAEASGNPTQREACGRMIFSRPGKGLTPSEIDKKSGAGHKRGALAAQPSEDFFS